MKSKPRSKAKRLATVLSSFALLASMGMPNAYGDEDRVFGFHRDFGQKVEHLLNADSQELFGIKRPLKESAPPTTGPYRSADQAAFDQVLLAHGLKAQYLTRNAADATDMVAFYPMNHPTHLITCVEGDREDLGGGKFNPSVQRIHLMTGEVKTILRGMSACDGIRATPWGTILATEEESDGGAYEILKPLATTEETVLDRATGLVTNPSAIAKRTALPTMAWEGIAVLPSGVVIGGDELRPGTGAADRDGGAIFKFVPDLPRITDSDISNLNESPLVSGNVYAMQVSCQSGVQQFGQGCEVGNAAWIQVNAATVRADADAKGATGYYRPEDLHRDPMFSDPENPDAVRFCWTNTQSEGAKGFAEVMCAVDSKPLVADSNVRTVVVNRFVEGDQDFNSFDNLEFQPETGIVYVIEDHDNGDIFACLPDGGDRNFKSDGCIKILSVKDSSAEPTGFIFNADGDTAYLPIQHSDDTNMSSFDGYPTDDVIKITGFRNIGWKRHQ